MTTSTARGTGRIGPVVRDYISLTKPRVMSLLLVTAYGGAVLAARDIPPALLTLWVLLGGALASGGASALNMWYEEELDRSMSRTGKRPVAGGRVSPRAALIYGITLNVLAFAVLYFGTNILAASLALLGSALYVVLYTAILKRTTVHNIVVGGAAGAVPPLVGYAAVLGTLELDAFYLFAIVFFWTPPHFWALAILIRDDYARAGIPMLPVVQGDSAARWQILLYTVLMLALTTMFYFATTRLGAAYLIGSVLLGVGFIAFAVRAMMDQSRKSAARLYKYSLLYLFILFALIIYDAATKVGDLPPISTT